MREWKFPAYWIIESFDLRLDVQKMLVRFLIVLAAHNLQCIDYHSRWDDRRNKSENYKSSSINSKAVNV